ncbi:PREDICTED: uncharacterized protein LOC105565072 [Vollenhovia emeryi]|uniref:uncharacterized protein LOC105565072 n=1 Tax=Vollenhovia emeryi TaxID=411798 RepID=UPI0005F542CD|nr:PREDICTED: uncharacterized protein LOC105565072 [Vollenhovia emeryi]
MSQAINKLGRNNSHKRFTIATANTYTSTPKSVPVKWNSISLSEIDTASSSSGGRRNLQLQMQDLAKKRIGYTRKKKREDTKGKKESSDSDWEVAQKELIDKPLKEKQKKNLKGEKKAVKRKQLLTDTDSDWETEWENSMHSQETILNDDERIKLFEDLPETIRDIPSAYKEILFTHESPIRDVPRKRRRSNSKVNDISQDTLLSVNLLTSDVRTLEELDEDETIFDVNKAKSHGPLRKPEEGPKEHPENFPTLRQKKFVKTYSRKTSQKTSSSPMKVDFMRKLPKISRKMESPPIPPGMVCDSGYWDKSSKKFIMKREYGKRIIKTSKRNTRKLREQNDDVYAIEETDKEFETDGQDGKRIPFREFCRRQKKSRQDAVIITSSSSSDT